MSDLPRGVPLGARAAKGVGLFYGWWVVAACVIGLIVCYPTFAAYAFGQFINPLNEEFGWTRTQITGAFAIGNLLVIVAAPLAGIAIDRFGARAALLPSILALAATIAAMGFLSGDVRHLYILFMVLPFAAAGTLPATFTRFAVAWFDRRRGLALGIALSGVGIGAAVLPPFSQFIIAEFGWRNAFFAIAGLATLVIFPIAAFFLVNNPSDIGANVDGDASIAEKQQISSSGLTLSESLRTRSFWLLIGVFFLLGMFTMGTTVHMAPLLGDRGLDAATAARTISLIGIFMIFGRVLAGYLLDILPAALVAFGCLAIACAGVSIIALGMDGVILFIAVGMIGFGIGAEFDFMSYFISRYFGMPSYGRIYGVTYAAFQTGGSIGPLMLAYIFDSAGSYTLGLWVIAGGIFLSSIAFIFMGRSPLERRT